MKSKAVASGDRRAAAFTLIELLVVIAIIAVLAGLLLTVSGFVQEKAGIARTQGQIQQISLALEAYKIDNGTYPDKGPLHHASADGSDTSSYVLIDALTQYPDSLTPPGKVYLDVPANMLPSSAGSAATASLQTRINASDQLVDAFGNAYHYYFDSTAVQNNTTLNPVTGTQNNGPTSFDLWSYGKAGETTNKSFPAKWITNWKN